MQLGNLGRKDTFCEAPFFGREEQGCGDREEGEGGGSAPLSPAHPNSPRRCCGDGAAPWGIFRKRNPEVPADTLWGRAPGLGRQTPSLISCPLFSALLAQELHQKKEKKSSPPTPECESQTHHTEEGTAPGPLPRPQRREATRFRETGSLEIAEAGNTWLGDLGAASVPPPRLHSPSFAPWHRFVKSPLPFASPAAAVSSSPTHPLPADPSPKRWVLQDPSLPRCGPPWIWHPAWRAHPERCPRRRHGLVLLPTASSAPCPPGAGTKPEAMV